MFTTYNKTWVLDFRLFDIRGLRKPIAVNRQSNTHAKVCIQYTRKVCLRAHVPSRHTTDMHIQQSVAATSAFVSDSYSKVPKFRISKNKA